MNPAGAARTEGWRVAVSVRGRELAVGALAGPTVLALVESIQPEAGEFDVTPAMENAARLGILRSDLRAVLTPEKTVPGLVLYDTETGASYRVTRVRDEPADVAVRLTTQVSASMAAP